MTKTTISFEIHDLTTKEVLCDNIPFDDLSELLVAYRLFYPDHRIEPCYREVTTSERIHYMPREEFKHDWFEMLDEIIENLEH